MSGILSGFTFRGRHCMRDYGLLYVESAEGRVITPARTVNEYAIAGTSGTVRFPGESYGVATLAGSLFPMRSPANDYDAQEKMREVALWLYGTRDKLIFDYEPGRYLMAEVTGESKWSYAEWLDGGLAVEFVIQPFAYAVNPSVVREDVTQPGKELVFGLDTGAPAPLEAVITNAGENALTGLTVSCGGSSWVFAGMTLASGGVLEINSDPPIGATITQSGTTSNALTYATTFGRLEVPGFARVTVTPTFSGGSGLIRAELRARGRWL